MAKKKTTKRAPSAARDIDKLDRELLRLLGERAELAADAHPAGADAAVKAVERNRSKLSAEAIGAVFREVVAACRTLARAERIAYLGPEHTFSHIAAIEHFGAAADLVPVATIAAVFEEVEQGTSAYGIVPLENSTDGRVTDTLECFAKSDVKICGELPLTIHHCLVGSGERAKVRRVESKPQALSQCRNWLARHLPGAECAPVASTADAARHAAEDATVAAISSSQAATEYGLDVLVANIEDNKDNVTRFAVIGREAGPKTGSDKTALMLEISHEPGALADAMAVFKRNRLNMTWIESFPVAGSRGRYLFFIEFVGHADEARSKKAIAALEKKAQQLVVLGSYASREPIG